jgi:hypothetical protein
MFGSIKFMKIEQLHISNRYKTIKSGGKICNFGVEKNNLFIV